MEDKKLTGILQDLQDDLITVDEAKAKLCDLHSVSDSFEVGIEVKITKRIHGHEFEIGEVVEIVDKEIDGSDVIWWCSNEVGKWCIEEDEAERYYR